MSDQELIAELEAERAMMASVATGETRIQDANDGYRARRQRISAELAKRDIENPNPFSDLWRWYSRWKSGDLPSYQSRRVFVSEMYDGLIGRLQRGRVAVKSSGFTEPTGWVRVDRGIEKFRASLETAENEEDFQTVGLLCREVLTSVAQAVFDRGRHTTADGVEPSDTDAKRMLEGFIMTELRGGSNETARRHAKAALDLANALQHQRTATFGDAALCAEATTAVVNLIAIISGRRDPASRA